MNYKHIAFLLCIVLITSCKHEPYSLSKIEGEQININDSLVLDEAIDNYIKPYRESINKDMEAVLSYAPETYSKTDGEFNTAIGNLMADAVFEQSNPIYKKRTGNNIDMVLLNHGGIRAIISKGNITTRTAFEVMPFENSIVVVELKGQQVDSLTYYLSKAKRAHPIHGLKLTLDKDFNIKEALINGEQIKKDKVYHVATNDYLYNGGDRMRFFQVNDSVHVLDYKIRNALLDYFKKVDTIKPIIDDRFIQIK
ncbi:5'-nucleotidase C-terminal domain-containing protein [Olleya aquimaris]|uniref:5'-nucleotidase n=1 Tax=Olleya aquimaris TaxID=639310 RepID=A0A327RMI6_9FLAO|nr:5'-nucleotidase [Olleya aquimaris]RAJ17112.1 5'-nucleotidase [Olleya aquimaris]